MRRYKIATDSIRAVSITIALLVTSLALFFAGCQTYKGGKVIDGTNLAVGITIPGTEWTINVADYVGGIRVCGNDATRISGKHTIVEKCSYFGVVTIDRDSNLEFQIEPVLTDFPTNCTYNISYDPSNSPSERSQPIETNKDEGK